MSIETIRDMLTLSNTQARDLSGSYLTIGETTYRFKDYDRVHPGQPPWRSGAEGKAYPLLGPDGSVAAYLKFFARPTEKRLCRTAWLIGLQMHAWLPGLAAAPLLWTDTRQSRRHTEIAFDFAGYLAKAVPGETWLELKNGITEGRTALDDDFRRRCVDDLILSIAVLEQAGIVHGDLSPNNIVIDLGARPYQPALYLIDFDAFVAAAAGPSRAIAIGEGGTYGTEGYCPPDLAARAGAGDTSAAPYSDRYGRDMLLMELLFMERSLSPDDPPASWNRERLQRRFAEWRASCDPVRARTLAHLDPATVFSPAESERPASADLAAGLGLSLPEKRVLRPAVERFHPVPALPVHHVGTARVQRPGRRTIPIIVDMHSRRPAPAQRRPGNNAKQPGTSLEEDTTFWLAIILPLVLAIAVALVALFGSIFG